MTDKFTPIESFVLFPEMGDDLFGNYSPKANPDHTLISEQDAIKERKELVLSVQQGAENQEKWLSGHSLLEQYNNCEAHDIRPSGGALKYICLGSSSSGINEDGWHDKYAMPYFQNLFKFYQENKGLFTRGHFPSHLLHICEQLKSFWGEFNQGNREEHAKKIAQTIIDLKPGECYHMPSGFAGDPNGHSMIILFQKQKGKAYTIKVYEGSENASKYAGGKSVNHKKYVRPYIKFEDVTCEELLFTKNPHKSFDPIILTKLLLLLEKTNRGDLKYESVVSLLTPIQRQFVPWVKLTKKDKMLSKFITQQRGPNCVEKTWNCLLLDSIDDRSDYKKLTLDNRFHTIVFYYLNHTDELASNPMQTRRLLSASTNFLRMVDAHFERGTIKELEYLHAVATIRDIIGRLSVSTAKQPKDLQALITLDEAKLAKEMVERRTLRLDHLKTKIQPEKSDTEAPSNITSVDPTLGKGITWPDLCINLYQLRTKKFDSRGLAFQIEFFMQNIRHLKKTTPNLTPHSAQQSLTQLLELFIVYIPAVNQLDMQQSCATQNTLMEMLAIAYQLAVQSDQKNVLQHYGLYYDHFERQSSLFLYAIQDPDQLEHRNELISFFSSLPKNWQLFDFETEHFDEEKFTAGLTPESKLYQDYLPDITQEDRKKYYLNSYSLPQELNYIKYLKSIAGLTTSIFKSKTKLSTLKEFYWPVYRIIKLDNSLQFACGYSNWDTDPKQESYELEYIPTSPQEDATKQTNPILDSFSHSTLGNHDIWTLLTENQWLEKTSGKLSESDHRERTLLSPLCEPSIEISLIFRIWTDYVQHLSHAELRPLFENVFFKTLNNGSQTISPLFLQIVQDPYFGSRVGLLTHEGFRHVKHLPFREEHLSSFYGFLSVMRMRSSMLYLWKTKNSKRELSEDLQTQHSHLLEWINRFLDSPTSTGALKTELLLAKTSLLMEKSLKEMSTEERVELMVTYCSLHPHLGSSQSGESPVLRREIQRRWLTMVPEWVDFFKTDASANDFLSLCIYEISKNKVNIDQNCVTGTKVAFSDWWIDLGLAQIGNSMGLWDNHQIDLPKDRKIERLFQKRKHHLTAFGNSVSFNDPIWGEIQVDVKTLTIERNFRGKKYTYIDSLDPTISNYQLNSSLIFDHALWICKDDSPHRLMICDLKTGKMTHKSNKEGSIFAVDSSNEFIMNGIDAFSIQDEVKAFESAEHMSCYRSLEGEWLLEFPRFKTSVGGVLRFIFDQKLGRWNYAENPSLYLDPNPIRNWGFDRCLNLVSQDGCSRTVLVAEGKISSTGYNPHCAIELPIDAEDGHKKEISYYEYEVVDDALQPQSFNGQLYLGSLTLACKQYQEAFAIFQKLSLSETPDKSSWKLFERLMSSSENVLDHSPNHTAVLFHVFYFFSQIDPYAPLFQNNSFLESVNKLFKKYYCHLANVESPLLLTREQELGVIKTFRGEAEYNGRWKELSSHPFEEEERMTEDSYPYSLRICQGKFPRTITHKQNQETLKNEFYKLLNDPDFIPRLQFIYSKPSELDWRRTVYSLATQNSHTLTDQFILFAAFLHERYEVLPNLPSKTADDATISKWWRDSINLFMYNHYPEDCYTPCNHVALEFKPTISRIDTKNKVGLPPQTEQPFSPIVLPELGQIHQKDLLLPLQDHYLVQPPLPIVQEEDELSQMNQISDRQDKQEEQSLPLLLPIEIKDPVYHNSIQERLSFYAKDRTIAANNKLLKPHFKPTSEDFIVDAELKHLKEELEGLTERCLKEEEHLTAFILEMANRKPTNPLEFAKYHTKKMGHSLKDRNILEICQTIVREDWNSTLRQMNPYLNADEIDHLKATVIDYMTVKTNRQQVEIVLGFLDSYLETQDPALLDLTAAALSESRVYNPEVDHFSLLFETMTGFRLRLQQAQIVQTILPLLVKDPKIAGIAFQAMMNTGKSSVIISTLMELASEAGLIACVFSHYSQLSSMKGNLKTFQKKRFNKDLLTLPYQLKDLGDKTVLETVKNRLLEAKRKRCGLIMKSNFPQIVQLKFILDCFRLKSIEDISAKNAFLMHLKSLAEILDIFEKDIVSFIDECDLILSLLTEVNVPFGEAKMVAPERVDLVAAIYQILIRPEVREKLRLLKDEQKGVRPHTLQNEIYPFVAEELFKYSSFGLESYPDLKEAFCRHLKEEILHEDQVLADDLSQPLDSIPEGIQKENVKFLRLMQEWSESQERYQKEAAELVGLTRHMFASVLPIAFSKSYNRNIGPLNPDHPNGAIIPYEGPDSPAKTKIGYLYLSLACHLQAALGSGIAKDEIVFLADKMMIAAQNFAIRDKITLLETEEAIQFYQLTGIQLNEVSLPEKLKEACDYVNDPHFPERCIKLRQEVAPFHVQYYPDYVSSNSLSFIDQIARPIACSGTDYNSKSFHPKVGTMTPDSGSGGSIINAVEERDFAQSSTHVVPNTSLESLMEVIKNHPEKHRIRSIIDAGGYLKGGKSVSGESHSQRMTIHPNIKRLLDFFQETPGTNIEAVIYLHHYTQEEIKNENAPEEAFVLVKRGESQHIRLADTTSATIAKTKIPLEKIFFLLDEPRSTGTDFKMHSDTLCLLTIDLDAPMRTLLQTTQRAREYFKKQHVEFCLTNEGVESVLGGKRTMDVVNQFLIMNEAVMISDLTFRSYLLQLPNIPRAHVVRSLCAAALKEDAKTVNSLTENYSDYLISHQGEEKLWQNFGRVTPKTSVVKFLEDKKTRISNDLTEKDDALLMEFNEISAAIVAKAANEPMLPTHIKGNAAEKLDNEVELVQEHEIDLDLDQDLTINQELQQDLTSYNLIGVGSNPYDEKPWKLDLKDGRLCFDDLKPSINPIQDVCKQQFPVPGKNPVTLEQFAECFEDHVYMTSNLQSVYVTPIPILHHDAKQVDFVLFVREDDKTHCILVSKKDAGFFKRWIRQNKPSNAWLVNLDGIPEAENEPGGFETLRSSNKIFNTRIQNGLWQANFYQGNIRYLEEHHRLSIHNIKSKRKLFGQYLALRNAYDSHKLQTTLRSFLIDVQSLSRKGIGGLLFSARREKMKKTYNDFLIYTQEQVAVINPELVTNLWPHQIPWLTTQEQVTNLHEDAVNSLDPSQIHLLSDHQIDYLTNAGLIAVLPKEKIRLLRKDQVYHLKTQEQIQALPNKFLNSIAPECVKFLKHTKIKYLKRSELIAEIAPDHVPYMAIASQVPHLKTAAQIEKLPDDLINEVLPQQVDKLSEKQIPLLTKEELIVAIPVDKIAFIMPQQVPVLTEGQIKAIPSDRGDLIREIPLPKVSYVTPLQVPQLSIEQVPQLTGALVDAVSEEQFAWLKDEQLTYLRKPESIQKIPLDKLEFICAEQVPHLDENQVKLMPDALLNHLVPAQVQFILDDKIRLLQEPTLIAAIHPDKVFGNIVEGQFKYLIEAQLANVPDHLNHWFDEYLIPEQVPLIPDNKVALLKRPELIRALLPRQIPHICVEQVKDLTTEEQIPAIPSDRIDLIQAIPENAVNFGHVDHIKHYTENQVKAMTEDVDAQKIEAIALDKIGLIQSQLVHYLTPDQIKAIPDDAHLLIQQIPLDKINHIRPAHVPHLTPEQIKAIPDDAADLIQQVPLDKINRIRAEHLPHLTPDQIAAIPDNPSFHIHQIPLDKIKHIRPEHVPYLTPNQVKAIPDNAVGLIQQVRLVMIEFIRPQNIPHLTPAQIAAIPEDMILLIQEIPAAKIPHIRPGHVPHLTPDQIQAIPNDASELIQKIPLDKINHIRPEHIPHLTPAQIASIPHNFVGLIQQIPLDKINHIRPEHVPHLAPAQIAAIPDNAVGLIQQIPLDKINHIRPEHVPHLTPAQIAAIPDNAVGLIQQIPVNKIPHIKTSHVPHLTVTQIKAISPYAQEHIQQIPLDKIGDIRPEQVLQLTQTQIQAIPNNATHLIQRISLNKMAHIKPEHVPHLTSIQIQSLPENAANLIQQIPTNKVQHILPKHVPHLTPTQIKVIQEYAIPLIQKIPTAKISHINPGHVPHLTEQQIKALPDDAEELIQNIPLNKISYIQPEHVPHLMHTQIQAIHDHAIPLIQSIPASKIAQIRPEHVPHLTPTQIEALPDDDVDLIERIPTDQLSHIRPQHVPHVPAKNLHGIPANRPDLIKQIPESNIPQIMPDHVKHLTQKQIQAIPSNNPNLIHKITNEQIQFVSPGQVPTLNSEQIHFLKNPKFIKNIPTKMIPQVTVEQVPHLDKKQIAHLPDHLFDHLTLEQLSLVPDDKIYLLNNPKLIAGLPNNKIPYVMDDQIQYLTNDQLQYLPMELELLLNVPEARRKYLTNEHLKKIYTPKNAVEALYNIVKGVTASLFGMGIQLPFWTVANFIWLLLLTVGAVFSKKAGKKWNAQCKETFVNTPVRKMLFVKIIYDYPGYKRSSWKWNQPSVAPAA